MHTRIPPPKSILQADISLQDATLTLHYTLYAMEMQCTIFISGKHEKYILAVQHYLFTWQHGIFSFLYNKFAACRLVWLIETVSDQWVGGGFCHTPPTKLKYTKTHILLVHTLFDREGIFLEAFPFNFTTWRRLSGVFSLSEECAHSVHIYQKMITKLMMINRIIIIYFFKSLLFEKSSEIERKIHKLFSKAI